MINKELLLKSKVKMRTQRLLELADGMCVHCPPGPGQCPVSKEPKVAKELGRESLASTWAEGCGNQTQMDSLIWEENKRKASSSFKKNQFM